MTFYLIPNVTFDKCISSRYLNNIENDEPQGYKRLGSDCVEKSFMIEPSAVHNTLLQHKA